VSLVELSGIEPLTSSLRKRYTTYFQQLSATKSSCFERKGTDNNPYCSFIVPGLFPRWHANQRGTGGTSAGSERLVTAGRLL